jgi:sec-independent protein translocase protein TatA
MPIGFHPLDLIIILVLALLIFGPKKLPEMGSAIGKSIKEFKKGMNELTAPKEEEEVKYPAKADLEAIDREVASKKAAASVEETPGVSETSSETRVE